MSLPNNAKTSLKLALDYRIISALLLVAIAVMLLVWKPWAGSGTTDRTVEVTGETTLKAAPDEFVFYPTYQVKGENREAALAELSKKVDDIVAKLKELGVPDKAIQTNTNSYDYYKSDTDGTATYMSQLNITLNNQKLAQKVQDYLAVTAPTGSVSPQYGFSDAKQKELESKARDAATKQARAKAEQMGKNLGFKVGKVKSVTDGASFGGPILYGRSQAAVAEDLVKPTSLALQPGENELPYSVTVVYFIR
jgi:uncharacterized protein